MRAILFDFGGTLDYPQHWLDRFLTHYHAEGLRLSRIELDPAFDAATRAAYHATATLKDYNLKELLDYLVDQQMTFLSTNGLLKMRNSASYQGTNDLITDLASRIADRFLRETVVGLAHSRQVLDGLATQITLGVVSNFYGNLDRVLADNGFSALVAGIADSGRIGIYKPDPALYQRALEMIGVAGHDTLMVGDSLAKDCVPARSLGMRTVWLRHPETPAPAELTGAADFTITRIEELTRFV